MPTKTRAFLYFIAALWTAMFVVSSNCQRPEFRHLESLTSGPINYFPLRRSDLEEYGALSYRLWMPELRFRHRTTFTTDAFGFRNDPQLPPGRIVMIGDSFVIGAGVSDDETLPVRLSAALAEPVYNFGCQDREGPPYFLWQWPRRRAKPPALVLWMPASSQIQPLDLVHRPHEPQPQKEPGLWETYRRLGAQIADYRLLLGRDNGLRHAFKVGFFRLDRVLFPPPYLMQFDGEPALVLTLAEQKATLTPEQRGLEGIIRSYLLFHRALAERGIQLVVAPIPETAELYLDVFSPEQRKAVQPPLFFDVLLDRLEQEGVTTFDLREELKPHRSPYLFIRDDHHFNPRALDLSARALAEAIHAHPEWLRGAVTTSTTALP